MLSILARSNGGEKRPSFEAILALAEALGTSPAAFFEFDREENDEKALRKKVETLLNRCELNELQKIHRVLRALVEQ
jgi:transcriptional regulator with XRE-family HTH domain